MELATLISFMLYSFVTSITPGPNNVMLTASGLNFGFKRSVPHILGIGFGFGLMVTMVGLGLGSILISSPILFEALRVAGIFYMLYLAWKIATAGSSSSNGKIEKPLGFGGAAIFQWVNPKAWIMTMGAITTYTTTDSTVLTFAFIGLLYGLISIPSVGVWALLGEKFQHLLKDKRKVSIFNVSMGLLLAISTLSAINQSFGFFSSFVITS